MTQFKRWGLLKEDVDYLAVAKQVNQTALYSEVASALKVPVPADPMKVETLFDGVTFDATKAAEYAAGFKVRV
jgi:nitrate/nitrite transport system substrate-binding protein